MSLSVFLYFFTPVFYIFDERCKRISRSGQYSFIVIVVLLYCIVLYCIVLYRTVPYRTVPYRTVPYRTVPYRTVPYRTVPYRTVPYRTVLYCIVLYCILIVGSWTVSGRRRFTHAETSDGKSPGWNCGKGHSPDRQLPSTLVECMFL